MSEAEAMDCTRLAVRLEYGTVVLQSGEDPGLTRGFIAGLVRRIKTETPLAVTLSLGERTREELEAWREAGADRYLLKHETSDMELFRRIHPENGGQSGEPKSGDSPLEACIERSPVQSPFSAGAARDSAHLPSFPSLRVELLKHARELGYEIGSGVMVGIPGQSFESLADDIVLFRDMGLEMIGCGPFVPHPDTPLGQVVTPSEPREGTRLLDSFDSLEMTARGESRGLSAGSQVPATDTMTTKVVALTRLVCPDANIPSTTALATVNRDRGRELGLTRGANVWMPNLTPMRYRRMYDIYPGKATVTDTAEQFHQALLATLARAGRIPGRGPGSRRPVPVAG
jgi:biotin synthase